MINKIIVSYHHSTLRGEIESNAAVKEETEFFLGLEPFLNRKKMSGP